MPVIAGCTQAGTNAATATRAATSVPSSAGTILSLRPVMPRGDRATWSVALLASASRATTVDTEATRQLTEFIVRTDAGPIISIVQANEPDFRPGSRVIVLHDDHTRLAHSGI
jgi:outer membrane lipoprotein SlyB